MSTKSRSPKRSAQARQEHGDARTSSDVRSTGAAVPLNLLEDLRRQQLAAATEAAAVLFRGSEAIRRIQQQAAHQASLRHQEALQKLQASSDSFDLLAIPSELLCGDMEEAVRYWQALGQNALQTQVEMIGCVNTLFSRAGANGFSSVVSAWQAAPGRAADGR